MISGPQHHLLANEMYSRGYLWWPTSGGKVALRCHDLVVRVFDTHEEAVEFLFAWRITQGRDPDTGALK